MQKEMEGKPQTEKDSWKKDPRLQAVLKRVPTEWEAYWLDNYQKIKAPSSLRLTSYVADGIFPGALVLDAGSGKGKTAYDIARKKNAKVIGIDINPAQIDLANNDYKDERVRYEIGDAADLLFRDDYFNIVFAKGVLGGVPKEVRKKITQELYRVVEPGGPIYIIEFLKHPNEEEQYKRDETITGEYGSRIIIDHKTGETLFYGKHFEPGEILELLLEAGFFFIESKQSLVKSKGVGDGIEGVREQITFRGYKPNRRR